MHARIYSAGRTPTFIYHKRLKVNVGAMEVEVARRDKVKFDPIEKVPMGDGECLRTMAPASLDIGEMEEMIAKGARLTPVSRIKANGTSRAPVDRLEYKLEGKGMAATASVSDNGAFGVSVQSDEYRLEDGSVYANALRRKLMRSIIDALESG